MTDPFGGRPPVPRPHPVTPPASPPVPSSPPPAPVPSPPPGASTALGDPTGIIGGDLHIAFGRGLAWSNVNRYDADFVREGVKHGVPPAMLKAMAVIESGGQMIPNAGGSGATGVMQIKPTIWGLRAAHAGYDLTTPAGQIGMAAAILGGNVPGVRGTTPEERFLATYYPTAGLDVPGEDGATPRQYLADMHELMRQIAAAGHGTTPAPSVPPPPPAPRADVLDLVFGGAPYTITATYGQAITWECPHCYDYQAAYGLDINHHYAYDVVADFGEGAPLYAPFDGKVVCAGTEVGNGAWGTGCHAFPRLNNYGSPLPNGAGAGRLELLYSTGERSLILGHVLGSRVHPGDMVALGDRIGQQGGMNASHVHVEGRYANGTKIGDVRVLFGGGGASHAEPVPIGQPDDTPPYVEVTAIRPTRVLQRGDPHAPSILPDLQAGDTFHAQHKVIGTDGKWYLVGRYLGRVLEEDTKTTNVVTS